MATEKTKVKTFRLKVSTLERLQEICLNSERKLNYIVQKALDLYTSNIKK